MSSHAFFLSDCYVYYFVVDYACFSYWVFDSLILPCIAQRHRLVFFLMIRRPPRSTLDRSSAASDVYKRQYYDNIGYADLSDFFYVWLRRSLRMAFPALFATLSVPKADELVATPYRHGSKEKAEAFFLNGMTKACLLYTSPSPRDRTRSRMPSSAWKKKQQQQKSQFQP